MRAGLVSALMSAVRRSLAAIRRCSNDWMSAVDTGTPPLARGCWLGSKYTVFVWVVQGKWLVFGRYPLGRWGIGGGR